MTNSNTESRIVDWFESQLELLLKIPAIEEQEDGRLVPRKTALLTSKIATEYVKFKSFNNEEKSNEISQKIQNILQ